MSDAASEDHRELSRSMVVSVAGQLGKLAHPFLFILIAALYGEHALGVFALGIAFLCMRAGLLGLDKTMLWWIPKRSRAEALPVLRRARLLAVAGSLGLAALLSVGLRTAAYWWPTLDAAVALMTPLSLALPAMAALEMFVAATLAQRSMTAQVVVKQGVVPLMHLGFALAFYWLGSAEPAALIWSFAAAQWVRAFCAWAFFVRMYGTTTANEPLPRSSPAVLVGLPRELVRYTLPIWGSDLTASLILRVDTLLLGALASPGALGVYAVASKAANLLRSIRRSFDPIVWALTSKAQAAGDPGRVRHALCYATELTILLQAMAAAAVVLFSEQLLSELGGEFSSGVLALHILTGFWLLNGLFGLSGLIVAGYGRSRLVLLNALGTLSLEVVLLLALVPPFGAAVAAGTAYASQSVVQVFQARRILGSGPYRWRVAWVVGALTLAAGAAFAFHALLGPAAPGQRDYPAWIPSAATLVLFVLVSGVLCAALLWRRRAFLGGY